jgi:hypothetical protein
MGVVYRGSIGHQGDEGDGIGQEVLPVAMGWFGRVLCICTVRIGIERREEKRREEWEMERRGIAYNNIEHTLSYKTHS